MAEKRYLLDDLIEIGNENQSPEQRAQSMQRIINDGTAWKMEGAFGRCMMDALEEGICCLGTEPQEDAYGNRIPARHEVQEGTKGSVEYVKEKKGEAWAKMVSEIE